ncbi:hypothetical protein KVL75_03195 [Helicobacter pylori]|uniref:Uncharacterized protein n=1 Tax=Helicobacter pylori TaxID=210 RepID=A0ABD6HUG8_HELPX|nr:hypothetical protein [Helicobacter pylori]MUU40929.1 hypothetical protein [Helicobacter pylori]WQV73829.1 hypothetical protein KVL75_03195 [Helicobacter pylori]
MANENVMTDLINDGSSFGVIFIANNDELIKKLRLILKHKNDLGFIWFNKSNAFAFLKKEPMSEAMVNIIIFVVFIKKSKI